MSRIKLAAVLVTPLAFLCSNTVQAQETANSAVQTPAPPNSQIQASVAVKDENEVYRTYVPYKGLPLKPAPTPIPPSVSAQPPAAAPVAGAAPAGCDTAFAAPKNDVYGAYVPYNGPLLNRSCVINTQPATASLPQQASPVLKTPPQEQALEVPTVPPATMPAPPEVAAVDAPPPACSMVASKVYGAYVPYTGPLVTACTIPQADSGGPAQSNSTVAAARLAEAAALPQPRLASPTANEIALAAPSPVNAPLPSAPPIGDPSGGAPAGGSGYIRVVPAPIPEKQPLQIKPFRSVAVGVKADTLGAGVELATPLSHSFNLRSSFNVLPFNYGFSIDGVNYNARFHLQSTEAALDWFPLHSSFHVSPGVLYAKNSLSGTTSVGPGQSFTLGNQPFINSVDDPAHGSASVIYPHKVAPMLLFGFGNIIPRSGSHFSFPVEFGAAYTGAPQMSVSLNGTACTKDGCANFGTNTQAQTFLKQEVNDLNSDLRSFPFYPIVSIGVAYHFYSSSHHAPND